MLTIYQGRMRYRVAMGEPAAPSVQAVELRRLLTEALETADNVDQMIAIYISHALDVWRERFDPNS